MILKQITVGYVIEAELYALNIWYFDNIYTQAIDIYFVVQKFIQ